MIPAATFENTNHWARSLAKFRDQRNPIAPCPSLLRQRPLQKVCLKFIVSIFIHERYIAAKAASEIGVTRFEPLSHLTC